MSAPEVTDQQLRDAGFTAVARNYPMSEAAVSWLAMFNGATVDMVPASWWYAPNEACRQKCEREAAALATAMEARSGETPLRLDPTGDSAVPEGQSP